MTLNLRNIWDVINKRLSLINAFIWGLVSGDGNAIKKVQEGKTKIPLALNVILLFILLFLVFVFSYGAYRRQVG